MRNRSVKSRYVQCRKDKQRKIESRNKRSRNVKSRNVKSRNVERRNVKSRDVKIGTVREKQSRPLVNEEGKVLSESVGMTKTSQSITAERRSVPRSASIAHSRTVSAPSGPGPSGQVSAGRRAFEGMESRICSFWEPISGGCAAR